jgi:hypothetical protein
MALLALIVVIVVSALAVKVGAVALTMTGLDRRIAGFQAHSAFTNTGWTTREAELLMAHDQRRRIVRVLMVLGHAGLASVIATLISSLVQRPRMEMLTNLLIIAVVIAIIYLLARWHGLDARLTAEIEKRLRQTTDLRVSTFEEVLLLNEGYGVVEVYVTDDSEIANKRLGETRLGERGMVVLAVDRAGRVVPAPDAETVVLPGDRLICYGNVETIGEVADERAPGEARAESTTLASDPPSS